MVDVSARAPRAAHRRPAGRPRPGGVGPGHAAPDARHDLLTRPIPRVPAGVVDRVLDPPTERFAAVPADPPPRRHSRSGGRVLARAGVTATLLALVAGGATAVAQDKVVTLTVDGRDQVVHTFADDVGGALRSAGVETTPQDRLEPAPGTDLADGDHVILQRARPLTLVEGPSQRRIWTTAGSVDEALRQIGLDAGPLQMSTAPDTTIPLGGLSVELRVPRTVTLVDGSGTPRQVTSTVGTVAALLDERKLTLGPDDVSVPSGDTPLTDGMRVQVVRNGVGEVVEVHRIAPPEELVDDPELPRGQREIVDRGRAGEQTVVIRVVVSNGEEVRRDQVRAGATTSPEKRVVHVGTDDSDHSDHEDGDRGRDHDDADGPETTAAGSGVWDALAKCEAGGNWAMNSGNGYYGGLQFDRRTWLAYGGDQYAPLPNQAGRSAQIAVATKVRDDRGGYSSWPACAHKLGLPT